MSLDGFLDKKCNYCKKDEVDCKCCDKCHDPECGICKKCGHWILCGYYCVSCVFTHDDLSGKDLNGWWHRDIWHG